MSSNTNETDGSTDEGQQTRDEAYDANVLRDGAEIHFTDERDAHVADRVAFLNGGWVRATYKRSYEIKVFPPQAIEGVYTHSNAVEDEGWW